VAFGQALAEAKGTQLGLIPAAHGGTSLDEWRVGSLPDGGRTLAGGLWERVQRARATARVELGGILWYQGEADDSAEDAQSYGRRFDDWVNAIRVQLDAPRLPVYVVQLGRVVATELDLLADGWVEAGLDAVREAQRAAPGRLADVGMVSAIDLGLVDDCHIDAPGLVRLGRRLARLVLNDGRAPNVVRVERAPDSGRDLHQVRVVCDGVAGGWSPASHITGFDIRDTSGEKHRAVDVVEAHPDPRDPRTINLILTSHGDFDWGIRVAYGLGFNAPCNAVDAEDMALPAFAAQPVRL
jgi:sialate O-acetylesterase